MIWCAPLVLKVLVNVAVPALNVAVPSVVKGEVDASKNVTTPVVAVGETVAVRVTFSVLDGALSEAVSAVVVAVSTGDPVTVTVSSSDVLGEYVLGPLYAALIAYVPAVPIVVGNAAEPEARFALPSTVDADSVAAENVTVPVAAAGVTVAVKVILSPVVSELASCARVVVVGVALADVATVIESAVDELLA